MSEHTPTPWLETGSGDIRGADNHLVGMVNPTGGEPAKSRAPKDRALIVKAVNSHDALVRALDEIDAVAVSKKAGSLVRMQRIARVALAAARASSAVS